MIIRKSQIALGDKIFVSDIIAENTNSVVHKVESLDEYGFDGSSMSVIKKEFPDLQISIGEELSNTFILIKDGRAVLNYDY